MGEGGVKKWKNVPMSFMNGSEAKQTRGYKRGGNELFLSCQKAFKM